MAFNGGATLMAAIFAVLGGRGNSAGSQEFNHARMPGSGTAKCNGFTLLITLFSVGLT